MRGRVARRAGVVAVVVVVAIAAAAGIVVATRSTEVPPATGAAAVVPADVLAYVHLSTDASRPAVKQALSIGTRLPDFPLLSAAVTSRLTDIAGGGAGGIDFATDIRPWLGKEAALALLDTSSTTAGSLVVLDVRNRAGAQAFLARTGASAGPAYRGVSVYGYRSGTTLAFVSHYLVFGQAASVRDAIDAASGAAPSLQSSPVYRQAAAGEPADRVLDAYLPATGVQRLLIPQHGLIGALGVLLYQPALLGTTISLSGATAGAKLYVHSALSPKLTRSTTTPATSFSPSLEHVVPAGSFLMLDATSLNLIASHVLAAGATGGIARDLGPLLSRLGAALASEGVNVQNVESLFSGETAVAIGPGSTTGTGGRGASPELIIVTKTSDQKATAAELANLELPLSELFPAPSSGSGQIPQFNDQAVDGVTVHQLALAPGLQFDYGVFNGLVVLSTSVKGVAAVIAHVHSLAGEKSYQVTLGSHPQHVTSLVFLDFSQLLSLAEQTGLLRGARYRELRPDLERVRAVGLSSTRGEADSTAELFLQIP
jgi:hypothetical protein